MRPVPPNVRSLLVRVRVPEVNGVTPPADGLMKARTLSEEERHGTSCLPTRVWVETVEGVAWTPTRGDVFPPKTS